MRYALRTFGSSTPRRRHFDTIDELEHGYDMHREDPAVDGMDLYGGDTRSRWTAEVHGGSESLTREGGVAGQDEESVEKSRDGITQTRSTCVTYGVANTEQVKQS